MTMMMMKVTGAPATDLAQLTSLAHCSASDRKQYAIHGASLFLAFGDSFLHSLSSHERIRSGHIALNGIQRSHAGLSAGGNISVTRSWHRRWVGVPYMRMQKGGQVHPIGDSSLPDKRLELELVKKSSKDEQVDAVLLSDKLKKKFIKQKLTAGQKYDFKYHGTDYIFTVNQAVVKGKDTSYGVAISNDTYFIFEAPNGSGIKIVNQCEAVSSNIFRQKLEERCIGGLNKELADIFRRALVSRVFPPHVTSKLGIKHVKGILLYGPPGTGKTLIARQIGKLLLNGSEPKIVNGPEVLNKFIGEAEKKVRHLFAEAENDQKTYGDQSRLHVIIFDEIDAICKARGSTTDETGVYDSIVSQLLTKIDGVESLNNLLVIGTTNRKDLLDEALLRPGRLEVQIEISLPDEKGRLQILEIHTEKIKAFLSSGVKLQDIAARTKNYSGAEIEGVVRSALSYALNRQISPDELTKPVDEESNKVTVDDFQKAVQEIIPSFGVSIDDLERCRLNVIVECGERHKKNYERAMLLVKQVKVSKGSSLVTCLLEGPSGSGKSAMAATVGIWSKFPYVKIISAESMIGLLESAKCSHIVKVFEDAYKSPLSIIILDDIERLLEYVAIGPRFSNLLSQALMVLLKRLPPKGKKLLVIGTTSEVGFLKSVGICDAFSVTYHVPSLKVDDAKKVIQRRNVFADEDVDAAADAVGDMPIKKLYMLIEMAAQGKHGGEAEAIYSGKQRIKLSHFLDCLPDIVPK